MTDDTKIMLVNMTTGSLSVNIPDLRYKRRWEKKGAKKPMPWSVLKEAIYDPGFEYMVQQGMLFIDSKDARIELGLEDGDTTEVICLNDSQLKRMATVMPLVDFKEQIKKIPYEQVQNLVSYMIENECADISKTEILKKMTGIDVMSAIKLNRQAKED
jgi:hypothetical protein|nr:MAG TPA: hypothetical protein [Caudoviricetes sp.]